VLEGVVAVVLLLAGGLAAFAVRRTEHRRPAGHLVILGMAASLVIALRRAS
jgi:hypothetical protein